MKSRLSGKGAFKIQYSTFKIAVGWLVMGMAACGEVTGIADNRFVAVDSLLDEQVRLLEALDPGIKKTVLSAGRQETKVFREIDWQKELSGFRQADLSKPGLRGAYTVEEIAPNVRVFRVKPGENSEVQLLRVEFTDDNRVKSLQSLVEDENYLYHTRRTFRVEFGPKGGRWLVSSYQVEGFQELLWSEAKPFAVRAEVL